MTAPTFTCPTCLGHPKAVNPEWDVLDGPKPPPGQLALKAHREAFWLAFDDERMRKQIGDYLIPCPECKGEGVVLDNKALDFDKPDPPT